MFNSPRPKVKNLRLSGRSKVDIINSASNLSYVTSRSNKNSLVKLKKLERVVLPRELVRHTRSLVLTTLILTKLRARHALSLT
jgi:hypothetical protein